MSLLEIREYLTRMKVASLAGLLAYFQCDADLLQQMMRHWIRKGCVRCFRQMPACGSRCGGCPQAAGEWYEWIRM